MFEIPSRVEIIFLNNFLIQNSDQIFPFFFLVADQN